MDQLTLKRQKLAALKELADLEMARLMKKKLEIIKRAGKNSDDQQLKKIRQTLTNKKTI